MLNIGRNEPCPCDSGKKYKKCCLPRIETNARINPLDYKQKLNSTIEGVPAVKAISEHISEEQISGYNNILHAMKNFLDSDEVEDDGVFDFFQVLYSWACKVMKFDDFFELVAQFKKKYPDIYKKEGEYIISSCVDAKLRLEQLDEAGEFFIEFSHLCGNDLDTFNSLMNKLSYYGCYEAILQGIIIIWPTIKDSPEIFDWAKTKLKIKYCRLVCFSEFLSSNNAPSLDEIIKKASIIDDDETTVIEQANSLLEIFSYNKDIDSAYIKANMDTLKQDDSVSEIIYHVLDAFISRLLKDNTITPCMAMDYWLHVTRYVSDRINSDLGLNKEDITHLFCPEKETLDKYILCHFTNVLGPRLDVYQAPTFLKAITLWIMFLFENDLIESPSALFKKISYLYISIYEMITTEDNSKKIKNDAKEMLITIRDLIESHENEVCV